MTARPVTVSRSSVEEYLMSVRYRLWDKFGIDLSAQYAAPLNWYCLTGRADSVFLRLLLSAKPFMVARKLQEGGSYAEAIDRLKAYLGY